MSISSEDENYMRLCMLIDIARQAVQVHFDKEFHPDRLTKEIKTKGYNILLRLYRKNVITETQWKILKGDNLKSTDFDIPLMICILKNLIPNIDISNVLPHSSLVKPTDDIARIKFHRNAIVHANRRWLSDEKFLEIWENVCEVSNGEVEWNPNLILNPQF
ncbi:Hypothetical predicted protein [Mytilus galloprovincialis]|uniref:DZIP3-like HEPN domain-containing protein n=1 Tax=Mytilus galloprovincialis TaxID=29158 RepID=A0A8B6HJP2_MYTGA|nr:Hypothetical predicted protein [Mytilus galloprovincialis]